MPKGHDQRIRNAEIIEKAQAMSEGWSMLSHLLKMSSDTKEISKYNVSDDLIEGWQYQMVDLIQAHNVGSG